MDVIVERQGALDVHKEQVTACVRVPERRASGFTHGRVRDDRAKAVGAPRLAQGASGHAGHDGGDGRVLEAVWHVLEDDFELVLVNARHVKQVPGRKTDVSDAVWLCQLAGAVCWCKLCAAEADPRTGQLTRYRKAQISERQREANRLHKALEDTGIKLDFVATDILAARPRDARRADRRHDRPGDPRRPREGQETGEDPGVREALEGRFEPLHALLIGAILAHIDFLDEHIQRISEAIEEQLAPFPADEPIRLHHEIRLDCCRR